MIYRNILFHLISKISSLIYFTFLQKNDSFHFRHLYDDVLDRWNMKYSECLERGFEWLLGENV